MTSGSCAVARRPARRLRYTTLVGFAVFLLTSAVLLLTSTAFIANSGPHEERIKPNSWNVVLITVDTTRADRLGCYGYRRAQSPNIDKLAAGGVRFKHCYAPVPFTLPSHASLLTGLVPPRHGIRDNGQTALSPAATTLAEILRRHNYATGASVGAFVLDSQFGLDQGFQYYDDDMSGGADYGQFRYAQRDAKAVTESAIHWWQTQTDGPKFLWVHYFDPHAPYAPPGFDPTFVSQNGYDAEINYVDKHLRSLLRVVRESEPGNTIVVLTSDHGESLGEHGESTHGLFTYDSTLRVPLIVNFPDRQRAGTVVETPVTLVDVMPSLLGWLGLDSPTGLDGDRLVPLQETHDTNVTGQRLIYFENFHVANKYGWSPLTGFVDGRWKFINAPRPELYDLADDPYELSNLFDPSESQSIRMMKNMDRLIDSMADSGALTEDKITLSNAGLSKLKALGYVDSNVLPERVATGQTRAAPDPKDMIVVYQRLESVAVLIQVQRHLDALRTIIDILTDEDPNNKWAMRLLIELAQQDASVAEPAIATLQQVIRRDDLSRMDGYVPGRLAMALLKRQRPREAIEALQCLLELEPNNVDAYRYLGDAHGMAGDTELAIQSYREAVRLAETMDRPPNWIGNVRKMLNGLENQ